MKHEPLTDAEEAIGKAVVDSAFRVHKELGPGLLEKIYEACFCYELDKKGLDARRQVDIPVVYGDMRFDEGLRIDVLVEGKVICELKAVDRVNPVWQAQLLSQMKMAKKRLGCLINFNVPLIRDGIQRMVL
ncbi:MAG: GxxExxY protein [Planctomycetes bacterium]|nr:GxxExxY protein [Planctomycetota bacterium]